MNELGKNTLPNFNFGSGLWLAFKVQIYATGFIFIPYTLISILEYYKIISKDFEQLSKGLILTIGIIFGNYFIIKKAKNSLLINSLKFPKVAFVEVIIVLTIAFFMACIESELISFLNLPHWDFKRDPNVYVIFVFGVFFAPILEEIMFRKILIDTFLKNYSPAISIIFSALIFGIIHINLPNVVASFTGGIIMGWMYFKTKSLTITIIYHSFNNLLALSPSIFPSLKKSILFSNKSFYELEDNKWFYFLILGLSILIVIVLLKILKKLWIKPKEDSFFFIYNLT